MKLNLLLLSFVSLLGCAASGCGLGFACTLVGCPNGADDSISVVFPGLATKSAGAMPLSIKVCPDSAACVTAELTESGGVVSCEFKGSNQTGACVADANDVQVILVLDAATGEKASVSVAATVTDSAGAKVIDTSKSTPLKTTNPNGEGCDSTCHDGTVTFTS